MTKQVMLNTFGKTFMSDPARADDRDRWLQRFMAQLAPEAVPMLRQVFGHPGNPPELLAQIQAPTLIIAGQDERDGLDDPLEAQRVTPDARMVTVPGGGHMVLVEQPDVAAAAVTELIRGVDAA